MKKEPKNWMVVAGEYSALAFLLPCTIFVGWIIGYYLDKAFGTGRTFTIIFILLGIAGGLIQIVRKFQQDTRDE